MSHASSRTPSPAPSSPLRSPTPEPPVQPVQPDHFYGGEDAHQLPPSPDSDARTWLTPDDDPLATRGIPVFKPTMEEFQDFEQYLNKIECWGMRSGIVKVIPPKEWTDALPALNAQLAQVRLRNPIEQHMFGRGGLFRQENVEKRRIMSMREWAELCTKEELRAPGIDDIGLHARATNGTAKPRTRRARKKRESETAEPDPEIKDEDEDSAPNLADDAGPSVLVSPPNSAAAPLTPAADGAQSADESSAVHVPSNPTQPPISIEDLKQEEEEDEEEGEAHEETHEERPKSKSKRTTQSRQVREAHLAERAAKDREFLETFDPHSDWLPPNTTPFDYTVDFCRELERRYWRNCGLGKPAWYGADMQGSLFTDETNAWNVANLQSALTRLLPASSKGLPGVNTPYLYFGMWRATFAWHVEDMDLFSINYVHFGAPKFWYAIPQARASALEQTMRGYFPKDVSNCSQFLRHKSFLASPTLLSSSSCRPNTLVQRAGEFVITFPMGYHAGFNLGLNCAESVNFALDSWIEIGRKAKACGCVNFSVRIDVDQLLKDREAERASLDGRNPHVPKSEKDKGKAKASRKRKSDGGDVHSNASKKQKVASSKSSKPKADGASTSVPASPSKTPKVTLKLGPKPKEPEILPCCLCVSTSCEGLLRVQDPPLWRKEEGAFSAQPLPGMDWMAHELCARVIPETWVDEVDVGEVLPDGTPTKERVVFGVDGIVKDRWNLKCTACTKARHKVHGAPIQCTKGKCPKAFHVSCARDGAVYNVVYRELREVEKEVVLLDPQGTTAASKPPEDMAITVPASGAGDRMPMDAEHNLVLSSAPGADGVDAEGPRVLKVVKKVEVQVLCSQHNPAVADAKRAAKQEKIKKDLLALPAMSRIKLRVSAGVFEVSLVRVLEESASVEVLWDRGIRKEFKWGSVVFGSTEGLTIGQKPTEPAPDPPPAASQLGSAYVKQVNTYPASSSSAQASTSTGTAQARTSIAGTSSLPAPYGHPPTYPRAPTNHYPSATWRYQYPGLQQYGTYNYAYNSGRQPYPAPAYNYAPYGYATQPYPSQSMHTQNAPTRELQWQRPYTGPKSIVPTNASANANASNQTTQTQRAQTTQPTQTVPYYSYAQSGHVPATQHSWYAGHAATSAPAASASASTPTSASASTPAPATASDTTPATTLATAPATVPTTAPATSNDSATPTTPASAPVS
ncbi:hypothetical protein WOLCODRAFT_106433 [Wolfiporia cocos MD-104 SS10]|uniref:[histone H3]-trimethyl-L-lysine(9) demethylase n=1 Tax=Wolfiporia cocos (strain MD-104) TaxID=742152 RepID=A0A2H3IY96_WOLCO|nr:hypothetical protein WOLCODRAFT_106433 [Wolfiporia cocos MD-104 SS10]